MAKTYTLPIATDLDRVRLLIGDTVATMKLDDDEITWFLAQEANVYLAAAEALASLYSNWITQGDGVVEKEVDELRIKRITGQDGGKAIEARIEQLRKEGVFRLTPKPRLFRVLRC